jgi:hypothetical protein
LLRLSAAPALAPPPPRRGCCDLMFCGNNDIVIKTDKGSGRI